VNKRAVFQKVPLVIGLAVAVAALILPGSAATGTTTKTYTANICASGPCPAPSTAPTLAGGATTTVDLTIANLASTQSLGSANVTAPAGFTVNGVSPLPSGSSIVSPGLIKLRNLAIAPGNARTFTINISVPCQSSDPAWTITAKQSNDFNGQPGNNFTLVGSSSSLSTPVTGACKLVFVRQPANAQVNTTVTSVDDDPSADPVTVEVHDGSDNLITTATGTVTLTPSSNVSSFSGTTASLVGGTANFLSLKSSATGTYTLIASGTGFASSDPSSSFVISDFGTVCPAGDTTCTGSASSSDKKTKASVTSTTSDGFGTATTLEITMLAAAPPSGACAGFTPAPGSNGVSVDVRPLTDLTEVTITLDKTIVNSFPENGAAHFNVCFGGINLDSPGTAFPTKSGTPAAVLIDGLYWGILPDCSGTPTTPCVKSRNKTGSGSAVIVFDVPDPWDLKGYTG
jgi:hypothetical protein